MIVAQRRCSLRHQRWHIVTDKHIRTLQQPDVLSWRLSFARQSWHKEVLSSKKADGQPVLKVLLHGDWAVGSDSEDFNYSAGAARNRMEGLNTLMNDYKHGQLASSG